MTQQIGRARSEGTTPALEPEVLPRDSMSPEDGGRLKNIGWSIAPFLTIGAVVALIVFLFKGAVWASEYLLPWLMLGSAVALFIDVLILLPLSVFRPLRTFTGGLLQLSSLLFGATTWLTGFILTLALWGGFAVAIGLFMFGVGVVPMAMLATLFKGMWSELISLAIMVVMTLGTRMAGLAISAAGGR